MPICREGHHSATDDYCDECGAPITPSTATSAPPAAAGPPDEPCPICGAPRTGRFCEDDGYDFVLRPPIPAQAPPGRHTAPAQPDSPAAPGPGPAATSDPALASGPGPAAAHGPAAALGSDPAAVSGPGPAASGPGAALVQPATDPGQALASGADSPATGIGAVPAPPAALFPQSGPSRVLTWTAVVRADRTYYDTVMAQNGPDAASIHFPAVYPERRIPLHDHQILIGRHSTSRGLDPHIDLSGPPEDPGVSHLHAVLQASTEGWTITDPGSTNGTTLNDDPTPIQVDVPIPIQPGDHIHVGAWTTITLEPPTI